MTLTKEYILTLSFECPANLKEGYIREYIRERIFTEGWAGIFGTSYIRAKTFEITRITSNTPAKIERDNLLSGITKRLMKIQVGTEPHDRISFKSVYQILDHYRNQDGE